MQSEEQKPTRISAGLDSPAHYKSDFDLDIEVMDLLEAQGHGESFAIGCVVKYIMRANRKNGLDDIEKAEWFVKWLKEYNETKELMKVCKELNV